MEERSLERPAPWPSDGGLRVDFVGGHRLVGATLPARDGSVRAGERQVTFAWFDVHREALRRRTGCLSAGGDVVGTLGGETIDRAIREELALLAPRYWPGTWTEAVATALARYDASRRPLVRALVARSRAISADYRRHVASALSGAP